MPRQGICDPGQALRIRDPSKTVALLGEPDPFRVRLAGDVLVVIGLFICARIDDQRQGSFVTGYSGVGHPA